MPDARLKFNSEPEFVKAVSNLTMLNKEECAEMVNDQTKAWDIF